MAYRTGLRPILFMKDLTKNPRNVLTRRLPFLSFDYWSINRRAITDCVVRQENQQQERVIVTGSLIPTVEEVGPSPMDIIDQAAISPYWPSGGI